MSDSLVKKLTNKNGRVELRHSGDGKGFITRRFNTTGDCTDVTLDSDEESANLSFTVFVKSIDEDWAYGRDYNPRDRI